MAFCPGWEYRPDDIAASNERMLSDGLLIANASAIDGAWDRAVKAGQTAFLACTMEESTPAFRQTIGDCVSMIYRSAQDGYNADRIKFKAINRPVKLCFETIYAGSRVRIGKGQLGNSDGSVGAWAAEYLARYGVLERGNYGGTNLSEPREDLAKYWGQTNVGVPSVLENRAEKHRFAAEHQLNTNQIADRLASWIFGGVCRSVYSSGVDHDGFVVLGNRGGHHTCIRGAYIDRNTNKRVFVEQQTHGSGTPDPHPVAHTIEGDVELSDGAYKIREEDLAKHMPEGEVWMIQPIQEESFR